MLKKQFIIFISITGLLTCTFANDPVIKKDNGDEDNTTKKIEGEKTYKLVPKYLKKLYNISPITYTDEDLNLLLTPNGYTLSSASSIKIGFELHKDTKMVAEQDGTIQGEFYEKGQQVDIETEVIPGTKIISDYDLDHTGTAPGLIPSGGSLSTLPKTDFIIDPNKDVFDFNVSNDSGGNTIKVSVKEKSGSTVLCSVSYTVKN